MGGILTNNRIEILNLEDELDTCKLEKVQGIKDRIAKLEQIESEVCPECGSYETESLEDGDDLSCRDEYHNKQLYGE